MINNTRLCWNNNNEQFFCITFWAKVVHESVYVAGWIITSWFPWVLQEILHTVPDVSASVVIVLQPGMDVQLPCADCASPTWPWAFKPPLSGREFSACLIFQWRHLESPVAITVQRFLPRLYCTSSSFVQHRCTLPETRAQREPCQCGEQVRCSFKAEMWYPTSYAALRAAKKNKQRLWVIS